CRHPMSLLPSLPPSPPRATLFPYTTLFRSHPDAEAVLQRISTEVAQANPEVVVAANHRMSTVEVGGVAIVVCAGSAHRAEAFKMCRTLIERIKAELPMWKKQVLSDGTHTWVGSA